MGPLPTQHVDKSVEKRRILERKCPFRFGSRQNAEKVPLIAMNLLNSIGYNTHYICCPGVDPNIAMDVTVGVRKSLILRKPDRQPQWRPGVYTWTGDAPA